MGGRSSSTLTRGLLEFSFKAEYAYDYGMPQWIAKIDHLLAPLHLSVILARPSQSISLSSVVS